MDPVDFWPRLSEMLEEHHGPSGRRLGGKAAVSIAYALIILPWIMVATVIAGLGGVLYLIQGTLDAATALRFSFVALAVLIGIPVSMLVTYVTTRGVKNKMFRELAEKQRLFREHLRMHDESPRWHIIIRTPEDARKKRASILEVISSYVKEVVDDELTRRTLMREQQEP